MVKVRVPFALQTHPCLGRVDLWGRNLGSILNVSSSRREGLLRWVNCLLGWASHQSGAFQLLVLNGFTLLSLGLDTGVVPLQLF